MRSRLEEKNGLTVRALTVELAAVHGIEVNHDMAWRYIRRLGLSSKKTLLASEQNGRKTSRLRDRWKTHQHKLDPARLVFIDESWAKTNMTRTRGWSPRGKPLIDKVPHGHWKTLTFLAGLRHDRIVASMVLDGPISILSRWSSPS